MKTVVSLSTSSPLTAQQRKACTLAKQVINDFLKNQPKLSAADTAQVMTVIYDVVDVAKKVNWSSPKKTD